MSLSNKEFSKLRAFLWPIHGSELKKFLPMLLMAFFISINYHLLKIFKDSLVVTQSGAEAIPFLKVWAMLPAAVLMTLLFTKLSRWLEREKVFYIMVSIFLFFFALFTFVLYPLRHVIEPYEISERILNSLPNYLAGIRSFVSLFRDWTLTLFYVMGEMWSAIILTVLYWSFINEITEVQQAKRFYGLIAIGTNTAGVCIGLLSGMVSRLFPSDSDKYTILVIATLIFLFSGAIILLLFHWMQKNVLTDPLLYDPQKKQESKEKRKNISLKESILYLARSRYVLLIAAIVISYNLVINLTEVTWKGQLKEAFGSNFSSYTAYTSDITALISFIAVLTSFFTGNLIRYFGWTFTAIIPPLILLFTTAGFFFFIIFGVHFEDMLMQVLGITPLAITVFFGSAQNVLSRASKYTFFDATKELAFTPLSSDEKMNAKAAIDGIGSRLGKSGGSILYQILLIIFVSISNTTPYVAAIIFGFIFVWIMSVRSLGNRFNELTVKKDIK